MERGPKPGPVVQEGQCTGWAEEASGQRDLSQGLACVVREGAQL